MGAEFTHNLVICSGLGVSYLSSGSIIYALCCMHNKSQCVQTATSPLSRAALCPGVSTPASYCICGLCSQALYTTVEGLQYNLHHCQDKKHISYTSQSVGILTRKRVTSPQERRYQIQREGIHLLLA